MGQMPIPTPLTSGGIQGEEGNGMALQREEHKVLSEDKQHRSGDGLCPWLAAHRPVSPQTPGAAALC